MIYSMVNLEGKTLDSFTDEDAARAALRATVVASPALAEELLLIENEDDGTPAGPSIMFDDLLSAHLVAAAAASGLFSWGLSPDGISSAFGYVAGASAPMMKGRERAYAGIAGPVTPAAASASAA